jgi:ATP-binding cassette, subfamily C (CFTR/MRP), member 4
MGTSFLGKIFFLDLMRLLNYIRKVIGKGKLLIGYIPSLEEGQKTETLVEKFENSMEKEMRSDQKLDNWGLLRIFRDVFGMSLLIQFIFVFIFFQLKVLNSYVINEFLNSIQEGDSKKSYFLCGMIGIILTVGNICFHQSNKISYSTFSQFKSTFMTVLYSKISKLTKFAMSQANIGRLVNMISADLNQLDFRFFIMVAFFNVFFTMISTCILLYYRFSWYGLIGPAIMIAFWVPNVILIRVL